MHNQTEMQRYQDEVEEQKKFNSQVEILENAIKPRLSNEARSRFNNLKIAHPDIAIKSLAIIAQTEKTNISDEDYKNLIVRLQPARTKINIKRI